MNLDNFKHYFRLARQAHDVYSSSDFINASETDAVDAAARALADQYESKEKVNEAVESKG